MRFREITERKLGFAFNKLLARPLLLRHTLSTISLNASFVFLILLLKAQASNELHAQLLDLITSFSIKMINPPEGSTSSETNMSIGVTTTDESLSINTTSARDAVLAHLSRNMSTREFLLLKQLSKQFATWVTEWSLFTAQARRHDDDSRDWYFPVNLYEHMVRPPPDASSNKRIRGRASWRWTGMHHPTREVHTLPSLEHLPSGKIMFSNFRKLLPTSGSLLLIILKTRNHQLLHIWNNDNSDMPNPWIALLVSNPLTQEYRVLPAPAHVKSSSWDYHGARLHLVEDACANTYKVVLLLRDRFLVFNSTTKCWSSKALQQSLPWGYRGPLDSHSVFYDVSWTVVGEKLFYAELEVDGNAMAMVRDNMVMLTKGAVRVYEVDYERGTWKPAVRYALRDFIPRDLHDHVSGFGFQIGSYAIEMVKCMGGIYILIPCELDVATRVGEWTRQMYELRDGDETYHDFDFLPLQFYVLQLHGDGLPFGQVLIQARHGTLGTRYMGYLTDNPTGYLSANPRSSPTDHKWYRSRGLGNMINIFLEGFYLQYNVMNGVSTTQALEDSSFLRKPDVSYRPSLLLKP